MRVQISETHLIVGAALIVAGNFAVFVPTARAQNTPTPRQTCTATNVGGAAYEGRVCGGSVIDDCTPGAIYQCQGGGVQDPVDNCVLVEVCGAGCLTGRTSTPPTVNTDFPQAADACFIGSRPLTVSTSDTIGGADVTVTATLSESQNTANGPILNLRGGGALIPHPFCAVPFRLAPGPTTSPASVSFGLPTAVVDAPAVVNLDALISYTDTEGFGRTLVSIPWTVKLQPGGTEPPAPAVKSVTVAPSVIKPGQLAVVDVELEKFAPARGILISLSSSNPAVASIIENGQPFVMGACTTGGGAANVQAASFVDATTAVTISAASGAVNEIPATSTITVTETVLDLSRVSLSPTSVLAGSSSTGTLTMTRAAPAGGAEVFLTSSSPTAIVPASVIVPAGQVSTTFPVTTRADASAFVSATIGGSYDGGFDASAQLVVWPADTAQAISALSLNPTSVVGPASSTGTVTMRYAPPSNPATVTLSSSNTTVARVPPSVAVPVGATQAAFTVSTSEVSASTAATISALFGDSTQTANITVKPGNPPPASAVLSAFTVTPTSVTGGDPATGIVTLASAAPSGGVAVDLGSQLPGTASVPASVTVPAGATSASFTITTFPPSGTTSVSLTASLNGTTRFATLTVTQAPPSAALSAVSLNPTSVVGGTSSTGTVTLTAAAPSGGLAVSLSDNSTAVSPPTSVTVQAGASSATFTVTTTSVASTTVATVTATANGATRTADLTVTAAGGSGDVLGFVGPTGNAPDSGGDGNGFELNAANAHVSDGTVAADMNSGSGTNTSCTSNGKDRHRFYDFGFAIPDGSSIAGIEVRLTARADGTAGSPRMCVQLSWDGGVSWTTAKATSTLGTTMATFTLGGATDTWGRTWTPANLANTSFRVRVINVASSTSRDFFLDWIGVRPHVAEGAPAPGPAALSAVSVSPSSVTGGSSSTGTVTLTAAAPSVGAAVSLASSNAAVGSVPASVTVPAGATTTTFAVTTSAVTTSTTVTISAAYNGVTQTAGLTVAPPPAQTQTATLTVTATGRSGERVTSSPAGINVTVGTTGSASFATGTAVTLSVTNGRDAIWSGACSSGGNKAKTCTLTLNANASVTANVQ